MERQGAAAGRRLRRGPAGRVGSIRTEPAATAALASTAVIAGGVRMVWMAEETMQVLTLGGAAAAASALSFTTHVATTEEEGEAATEVETGEELVTAVREGSARAEQGAAIVTSTWARRATTG